jgi:hypothetical protein
MKPAFRVGQAFLGPFGTLLLVVSGPWTRPLASETEWRHDLVAFPSGTRFSLWEESVAELERLPDWTQLA